MHRSRLTSWLSHVVVIATLVCVGPFSGLVLCSGPSGHYEIEPLNAGCCYRASTSSRALGARHRECSRDCIDTLINSGPALTTANSSHHYTPAPPLLSVPVVTDSALRLPESSTSLTRFPASAHLPRFLRTTVILC